MAITAEARTDIIALVVGMFDAAPGATFLSQFVNSVDAGATVDTLAADLSGTSAFKGIYPDLQTANEFATKFVNNIAPEATDAAKAWAVTWIEAQLNGGATKAEVIVASINALRATDEADANWGNAAKALNNKVEVAEWYSVDQLGNATDLATLQNQISTVTSDDTTVTDITSGSAQSGDTFTLTSGVDQGTAFTGSSANDQFNADHDITNDVATLGALDILNGGAGTDTLSITSDDNAAYTMASASITDIENITIAGANNVTADVSGNNVSGLESISVTKSINADVTADSSTAVSVSGATGTVDITGGSTQAVTASSDTGVLTLAQASGAVTVTATGLTAATNVDDGTDVTVTNSVDEADAGNVVVGNTTAASGAVAVTQNVTSDGDGAATSGSVTVDGGTTVTVTNNATSTAAAETNNDDITLDAVNVTGDNNTTEVTVAQNATVTTFTKDAVADTGKTFTVEFKALAAGETTTVNGLTFTASKALTAEEAAQAFASLANGDTQSSAGDVANGAYSGAFNTADYSSSAASGDTVVFTSAAAGTADIVVTAGDIDPTITANTAGVAGSAETTSTNAVVAGTVTVTEGGTASIATITLDNYGNSSDIVGADALTTLNLANSAENLTVDAAVETLTLNVNNLDDVVVDLDDSGDANNDTITSLTINATGAASEIDLEADAVTTATIAAAVDLDISGTPLAAVETVTITGAGNVALGDISGSATTVDASASTGGVTVTVDGTSADVTGGEGNDSVTVDVDAISKDINLGKGDDTLVLNDDSTSVPTGTVAGGEGTDTVSMTVASAVSYDNNTNFQNAISGFERLTISDVVDTDGGVSIDLEALGFSYVTTSGTDDTDTGGDVLTLNNMANNGTVVLTAAQGATNASSTAVAVKDADTTDATLNVVTTVSTADINAGTLTVADVETINITATDSNVDEDADGVEYETGDRDLSTLDLDATSATTVVVDGNANLTLDMTGNTAVTSIDASALTGNLTVTAFGTATVTGGAGDDVLTADGSGDTLLGGAGNDTLTGDDLTTLTGGEGNDIFVLNVPTSVVTYSTITDLSAGDTIQLTAGESFVSTELSYAGNASFQDVVNLAVNTLADDNEDAAWFQFGGNTYVVQNDDQADATDADFENGIDGIIEITGEVDLSSASYNVTDGTLVIA